MYSKFIRCYQCKAMPCVLHSLLVVMGSLDQIKELIIVDDVMLLNVFTSELMLFIRRLSLSSESHNVRLFIAVFYNVYHSVDGKQVIGHHVLKVVVGESEEEMLHVFKDTTISQYQ